MAPNTTQANPDQNLRDRRLEVYEGLWQRLQLLARYDRPLPLTAASLKDLTVSMRDWYFNKGGLFLSEDSRPTYFKLKEDIEQTLKRHQEQPEEVLSEKEANSIVEAASRLRAQLANDVGTRKSTFSNVARADPSNIQQVAASQLELINDYYTTILHQARQSFTWAIIAAGVGLAFFIAAVAFLLLSQKSDLSAISVISGALIEVISGINFYLYGKAISQLDLFHVRLERTQRFLIANSVCENLKGSLQQTARAGLVNIIAGLPVTTPEASQMGQPPGPDVKGD